MRWVGSSWSIVQPLQGGFGGSCVLLYVTLFTMYGEFEWVVVVLFFAVFPTTIFFLIVIIFEIRVTSAPMNAFIFECQNISIVLSSLPYVILNLSPLILYKSLQM